MTPTEMLEAARNSARTLESFARDVRHLLDLVREPPVMSDADLIAQLIELAEADDDTTAHFKRFPTEDTSSASKEDWSRCLRRRDAAIKALASIGAQLRERQGKDAA